MIYRYIICMILLEMSSFILMYTYSKHSPGLTKREKDTSELTRMKMT